MNLKTRSALAIVALLLLVFGAGSLLQDKLIRDAIERGAMEQQYALVTRAAEEIDQRILIGFEALERLANRLGEDSHDPEAIRRTLADNQALLAMFDALIVVDPEFRVVGDVPVVPGRVGTDVSGLEHQRQLRESGRRLVSRPVSGRVIDRPLVAIAVPIRSADGSLRMALSGTLDLLSPNFLGQLNERHLGSGGYFFLTTRARETIVGGRYADPLTPFAAVGELPPYDRALDGWSGSESFIDAHGRAQLTSLRTLESVDWVIGAVLPAEEAFASVGETRRTALMFLVPSAILFGLLFWLMMRANLRPLLALRDDIVGLRKHPHAHRRMPRRDDEIGEVAHDFYDLFDALTQARIESDARAQELQSILDACPLAIAIIRDRIVQRANPAFERMFGYTLDEVTGTSVERYYLSHQEFKSAGRRIADAIANGRVARIEQILRDRKGRAFWANIYARLLDPAAPEKGPVVLIEDISERKASEDRIRYLAEHDVLTGLPNRMLFNDRVGTAIERARRDKRKVALLFLDIDRFKNINDSLGHQTGDRLLQQVAERLKLNLRGSDSVGRPGGDEFAVLIPDIGDAENAARIATKLLEILSRPYAIDEHRLVVTASIGIALYPDDGEDLTTLSRNADAAMYHGKESGRNAYRFFHADMNTRVLERLQLEGALRQAIENGDFQLHYQPQIDSNNGAMIGVEALLRWHHPEQGMISPGRFIPVAEESGLILPLGGWVLREACRQNREWQARGLPALPVAVNISALQFLQPQFVDTVRSVLTYCGLPPHCLEIELTESIMMDGAEHNIELLKSLRELGVRISIDDFGTGYSSLAYLKRLPIDKLKIDQAFVRDITTDLDDAVITSAIIGLAHNLRLGVIAEGVETPEQQAFLLQQGCAQIQGYLISRPLPPDAFEAFWRASLSAGKSLSDSAADGYPG